MPKTCNTCLQKRIKAAYRSICEACAEAGGKCPGCGNALGSRDDTRRNEEAELDAGGSSTAGEPQAAVSSTVSQHADEAEEKV